MFKTYLKDLNSLKHYYSDGQPIWFACLIPHFDWFEKILSIEELVEPFKTKIIKTTLMPDQISNDDKFLINELNLRDVVRKYKFNLYLEPEYKVEVIVYEQRDKEICVLIERSFILDTVGECIEEDFMKLIIEMKSDFEFDDTTIFKKDENYELFKEIYNRAADIYPEEVIKAHDKLKNNV